MFSAVLYLYYYTHIYYCTILSDCTVMTINWVKTRVENRCWSTRHLKCPPQPINRDLQLHQWSVSIQIRSSLGRGGSKSTHSTQISRLGPCSQFISELRCVLNSFPFSVWASSSTYSPHRSLNEQPTARLLTLWPLTSRWLPAMNYGPRVQFAAPSQLCVSFNF